jgi:hypothetical protein
MSEYGQLFGSLPGGDWAHDTVNRWAQNQWSKDYLLGNTPAQRMLSMAESIQKQAIESDNLEKTSEYFKSVINQNNDLLKLVNTHSEFNFRNFELSFLRAEILTFHTSVAEKSNEVLKWAKKGNNSKAQPWFQETSATAKKLYDRVTYIQAFAYNFDKYMKEIYTNVSEDGLPWKLLLSVKELMKNPENIKDRVEEFVEFEKKLSQIFDDLQELKKESKEVVLANFEKLKTFVDEEIFKNALTNSGRVINDYLLKLKELDELNLQFGAILEDELKKEERNLLAKEVAKELMPTSLSLEDKLTEIAELLAKGVITEDEYARKRTKLIDSY